MVEKIVEKIASFNFKDNKKLLLVNTLEKNLGERSSLLDGYEYLDTFKATNGSYSHIYGIGVTKEDKVFSELKGFALNLLPYIAAEDLKKWGNYFQQKD